MLTSRAAAGRDPQPADAPRVLVVDPFPLARRGLADALDGADGPRVDAEADGLVDALDRLRERAAAVVVTELTLPDADGLDAIGRFRAAGAAVLVLTGRDEHPWAPFALQAGAAGFVHKGSAEAAIVRAVAAVADGRRVADPSVLEAMLSGRNPDGDTGLSTRELQVAHAIVGGRRRAEIARLLSLSPPTVTTYRRRVLAKLGLRTNADLARYVVAHGWAETIGR